MWFENEETGSLDGFGGIFNVDSKRWQLWSSQPGRSLAEEGLLFFRIGVDNHNERNHYFFNDGWGGLFLGVGL